MSDNAEELTKELIDAAKNWLAIDGLWFLEIEKRYGLDVAIECDAAVWKEFSRIEAERIMARLHLQPRGGLDALEKALHHRLFSLLNTYEIQKPDPGVLELFMKSCRTQAARDRKGLPLFPCKTIGLIDYEVFAHTIDPAIQVACIACPPDTRVRSYHCGWRFTK
jgi:hypothetical protein